MRGRGTFIVYSIAALLAWAIPSPGYSRGMHPSDKSVVVMLGELKTVRLLAFSPDSRQVASGDDKGNVEIWEMYPVQRVRTIKASSQVVAMAFSPDGQQLATSGADGRINVWKLGGDELVSSFEVAGGPVYSIGYAPDGNLIAAGCKDGAIRLYSAEGELHHTFGDIVSGISVFLSPAGPRVAAVELQGLQIWDAETGQPLLTRIFDQKHVPSPYMRHMGLTPAPIFGISPGAEFVAVVLPLAPGLAPPEFYTLTIQRAVSGEKVVELGAVPTASTGRTEDCTRPMPLRQLISCNAGAIHRRLNSDIAPCRFCPDSDQILRRSEMSRWATSGLMHRCRRAQAARPDGEVSESGDAGLRSGGDRTILPRGRHHQVAIISRSNSQPRPRSSHTGHST
jgi:WD40 repeat protein